jgi:hypothetical protein
MGPLRESLRRALSHRVSVEAMLEVMMWLTIPYVVIGLVWAFFHADQVQQIETLLQTRLPAGSEIAAFGQVAVMWPVLLLAPNVCML